MKGGAGIANTDFVVFVTAYKTDSCTGATGAHASHCVTDEFNWCALPETAAAHACQMRRNLRVSPQGPHAQIMLGLHSPFAAFEMHQQMTS